MGMGNDSECLQYCVQGPTFQLLMRVYYPAVLLFGLAGNVANILVYSHAFLRTSPTVRLLSAKAAANLVHILSLLPAFAYYSYFPGTLTPVPHQSRVFHFFWPQVRVRLLSAKAAANLVHILSLLPAFAYYSYFPGTLTPVPHQSRVFHFFWPQVPYMLFLNNFASTIGVWLTVGATLEHYLLVAFPVRGRQLSSMRNSNLLILCSLPAALSLHVFLLVYYRSHSVPCYLSLSRAATYLCCKEKCLEIGIRDALVDDPRTRYHLLPAYYSFRQPFDNTSLMWRCLFSVDASSQSWLEHYQRAYFWTSSILSVLLPLLLLIFLSACIYARLFCGDAGRFRSSNSEQKECVVRLALAATASHLLFETPQVPVFITTAFLGTQAGRWSGQEVVVAVAAFASLTNSALPFCLYLACSSRFRILALQRLCPSTIAAKAGSGSGGPTPSRPTESLRVRPDAATETLPLVQSSTPNPSPAHNLTITNAKQSLLSA